MNRAAAGSPDMSASAYAGPPPPDHVSPDLVPDFPPAGPGAPWTDAVTGVPVVAFPYNSSANPAGLTHMAGSPWVDLLQEMVDAAVAQAMRDPALLAAALVKLPQEVRDQARVLLDALESGSPRP